MIGVLVSGEGTNLQALIDEGLPIAAVASNRAGARGLERAAAAGIASGVFPHDEYAGRDERDAAMADWLVSNGVEWVVLAGYMQLLRPSFLDRFRSTPVASASRSWHPSRIGATTISRSDPASGYRETPLRRQAECQHARR